MSIQDLEREIAGAARAYVPQVNSAGNQRRLVAKWPRPLNLTTLASSQPRSPDFIIDDWLPAGYATLIAGHGGSGKSSIALSLLVCMALGVPFYGLNVKRRRVLFLSCEDRESVLHWRLSRICSHLGAQMSDLDGWLDIADLVGHDTLLWTDHVIKAREPTPAMQQLAERVAANKSHVILIDGVADTFGGNENNRAEVKAYINALLALVDGEHGALILIGHVAKASTNGGSSEGYSGSTGWHNSVRARWYLHPETRQEKTGEKSERTGDLILDLQKSNLGRTDQSMRFTWDDDAHLFTGKQINPATALDRQAAKRREQDGIMAALTAVIAAGNYVPAATTGQRTAYHVLSDRPEFTKTLSGGGANRKRFWTHIEALRRMTLIQEGFIRRKDGKKTLTLEPVESLKNSSCGVSANG